MIISSQPNWKFGWLEIIIWLEIILCLTHAQIIAACPNIRRINDKEIDLEERLNAMITQGSKQQKKNIDFVRWDLTFATLPDLKSILLRSRNLTFVAMTSWQPHLITKLSLPNCKLTSFHIGTLTDLQELDLSHNYITDLLGSGIEQCQNLVKANLSYNKIVKKQNLRVFEYVTVIPVFADRIELTLTRNFAWESVLSDRQKPASRIASRSLVKIHVVFIVYSFPLFGSNLVDRFSCRFTSRLQYLWMDGNRDIVANKDLSNYRTILIFITRNLKGTNRATGLLELDGSPITMVTQCTKFSFMRQPSRWSRRLSHEREFRAILVFRTFCISRLSRTYFLLIFYQEERIQAVSLFAKKRTEAALHRFYLCLIDYYGHHQMRLPNFISNIRHLKLPNSNLNMVDLRGFFSVEVLDLSGNALQTVDGIKELPKYVTTQCWFIALTTSLCERCC